MRVGAATAALKGLTPAEAISAMASLGYAGVEFRMGEVPDDLKIGPQTRVRGHRCTLEVSAASVAEARKMCDENGLAIFALAPFISIGDIQSLRRVVDLAAANNIPVVRLWAAPMTDEPYGVLYDRTVRFIEQAQRYVHGKGVQVAIETHHGTICSSASLTQRVVFNFPPEDVGVIYDFGNLLVEGYEDHRIGLDLIGDHLSYVQVKNASYVTANGGRTWKWQWCPLDEGILDVPALLDLLRCRGYSGWLSVEDFSSKRDDQRKLSYNADLLRQW